MHSGRKRMRRPCQIVLQFMLALVFALNRANATDVISTPFYGVQLTQRTLTSPRPLNIDVLQIDLNAPGISFFLSPPDANPPLVNGVPDETITQTTRQFVTEVGAQFGINTTFFRLENGLQAL